MDTSLGGNGKRVLAEFFWVAGEGGGLWKKNDTVGGRREVVGGLWNENDTVGGRREVVGGCGMRMTQWAGEMKRAREGNSFRYFPPPFPYSLH